VLAARMDQLIVLRQSTGRARRVGIGEGSGRSVESVCCSDAVLRAEAMRGERRVAALSSGPRMPMAVRQVAAPVTGAARAAATSYCDGRRVDWQLLAGSAVRRTV